MGLSAVGACTGNALGMCVLAYDSYTANFPEECEVVASLEALLTRVGVISLDCPLTVFSLEMINAKTLNQDKLERLW